MTDSTSTVDEIRDEAEAWRAWTETLRTTAYALRGAEAVRAAFDAAGISAGYIPPEVEIKAEVPDFDSANYTAAGLRSLVLEPLRKRHAEAKAAVRELAIAHLHELGDKGTEAAFAALGLEPLRA